MHCPGSASVRQAESAGRVKVGEVIQWENHGNMEVTKGNAEESFLCDPRYPWFLRMLSIEKKNHGSKE
jgi:hypothetical protein